MAYRECDLCGRPAETEAIVEGARVSVCAKCARFGSAVKKPPVVRMSGAPLAKPLAEYSLAEGYGRIIVEGREKHGLTRSELAGKLFISEHELARLEEEKLKPREQVARKLERELKITLVSEAQTKASGSEVESSKDLEKMRLKNLSGSGGLSLADVVSIKHKQ